MYRSRLQNLEEKNNIRKATLLSVGTVVLVLITVVLGIPFLIRIAGFLGDIKSTDRPVDKNDLIPPVPPQISLPYDATNSATQTISGTSEPGATVFLTLNGQSSGDVVVSEDSSFSISDIHLSEGDNSLAAVAIDQSGNKSVSSTEISLYYSNKAPELEVESPTDYQQVSGPNVEIKGTSTPGVRLTVNERSIIVSSEGKFSTNFNLTPGENVLVFIVSDKLGNQTRKELTVISNQ